MVPVEQCLQRSLLVVTPCLAYQSPTSFARGAPLIMKATPEWYYVNIILAVAKSLKEVT